MVRFWHIGILLIFFLSDCNSDKISPDNALFGKSPDGLTIELDNTVLIQRTDIDYYDFSTNIIYLKNGNTFLRDFMDYGKFNVYADHRKIYEGSIHPGYSSTMPILPFIWVAPPMYQDNVIRIDFINLLDSLGNPVHNDPRSDIRNINALKKYNQCHAGLLCTIDQVRQIPLGKIQFTFTVSNNDIFNYFILSPEKMGSALFHYFTNGLLINIPNEELKSHKIEIQKPDPWNGWEADWFYLLESGNSKTFTITYEDFDPMATGRYDVSFVFPGLSYQVSRDDLDQGSAKIWLGDIYAYGTIIIP